MYTSVQSSSFDSVLDFDHLILFFIRMLKTIKKEPAKFGVDEQQLFQFEKMMLKLKGFILEGLTFQALLNSSS